MKTNLDLDKLKIVLKKNLDRLYKHGVFVGILMVLLAYVLVVWKISTLATAEPSDDDVTVAETTNKIPRIDKTAIKQIQSLEQENINIHSLFNDARNNPFQE